MKIIRPVTTICDNIIESNVVQDHSLYVDDYSFAKGDTVVNSSCGSVVYQSLANNNIGHSVLDTNWWVPIGTSNYYAMFDSKNGTQTQKAEYFYYKVAFTSLVNSIALINVEATEVRLEVWDTANNLLVDVIVSLRDYGVNNWYDYYFKEINIKDNYIDFSLPALRGGTGKISLTNPTGIAKLGSLIYGDQLEIGQTQWGATLGIKDYSTKETDEFGNYFIVERAYSDRIEADVVIDHSKVASVKKVLAQYRAQPVVWAAGDQYNTLITFGYYRDFSVILSSPAFADCSISIEGLI